MKIDIFWPWELPEKLKGLVIVADVYAATTNIISFLGKGVKNLWLVNGDSAAEVKKENKKAVVIGENPDLPADFFDATNFPWNNKDVEVKGKTVIFLSNNGTRVIEEVFRRGASEVMAVGFNNISAMSGWLRVRGVDKASLVAAGEGSFKFPKALEDISCVESLRSLIEEKKVNWKERFEQIEKYIRLNYKSEDFSTDLEVMLDRDRYSVVPGCFWEREGLIRVRDMSKKVVK